MTAARLRATLIVVLATLLWLLGAGAASANIIWDGASFQVLP